jgi:ABC-type transporter Mla subunit MlaD
LANAGGGGGDDTEARLRVLETHVDYIKAALERIEATANSTRDSVSRLEISMKDGLSKLEVGAAELRVKVDHLPTLRVSLSVAAVIVALVSALMVFLGKIGLLAKAIGG